MWIVGESLREMRDFVENFGMMVILGGLGLEMGNLVARIVNFGELYCAK